MNTWWFRCLLVVFVSTALLDLIAPDGGAAAPCPARDESWQPRQTALERGQAAVDLDTIQALDRRLQRGEITELEMDQLWTAYLARRSEPLCTESRPNVERPRARARLYLPFVGPGF